MSRSTLSYGSKGDEVKTLQDFLNGQGYKLTVDGDFGINTQNAVKDFQTKNKLTVDGIVGVNTWGVIDKLLSSSTGNSTGGNANTGFTYKDYTPGGAVTSAGDALNNHLATKPTYTQKWDTDSYLNKWLSRDKFSYDVNSDALYQQYADQYTRLGNMAMQDTMGQAAAMTGGYGSSYATTAGNQAYQGYLQQLNEVVPELYQMALNKYNQEGQDLYNQYAAVKAEEDDRYGKYRDSVSDYNTTLSYLTDRYDSERDYDYEKYLSDKGYAYDNYRDRIEDSFTERELSMAEEEWELQKKAYENSLSGGGSGGGSGSGKGTTPSGVNYDNGSLSTEQVKELQKAIGANADGYYGPNSKKAAGGLSAEEAWEAYQNGKFHQRANLMDFNRDDYQKNVEANGGSYYGSALADLKEMKSAGRKSSYVQAYLAELVANSLLTGSEYSKLYNMYRDNKL